MSVSVNGVPNKVYSQGLDPAAIYGEVTRRFQDFVSPTDFFKDKYALWVDMRTSDDNNIHGQGLKLVSTQDGVTLEIKRTKNNDAQATDKINCHIFVVKRRADEHRGQPTQKHCILASRSSRHERKIKISASYRMLRVFENSQLNLKMQTITNSNQLYFKAKEVAMALGYEKPGNAIEKYVPEEYKKRLGELKGGPKLGRP